LTRDEWLMTNDGIACAAQALAPRVALSFRKIHRAKALHFKSFYLTGSTGSMALVKCAALFFEI